jgi:hypothetical protein
MAAKKVTPAARARARRDPAIFQAPPRIVGDRRAGVARLTLNARGRVYPIGANIDGETPWSMGMDQAAQVTLPVRDMTGHLVEVLDDEAHLQQDGVRTVIDGVVYCVTGFDHDGEGLYTLTVEDETAWLLKQYSSFRSASRARTTRFGFIQGFVDEASRPPLARMRSFIPEIDDKQKIQAPKVQAN